MTLSLTNWLTNWLTFDVSVEYNDYNDYYDNNDFNDYRDSDLDLDLDWVRFSELVT